MEIYGKYEIFKTKNMGELWEFYEIHSAKYWWNCSEFKLKVQTLWEDEIQKQLIVHKKSWVFLLIFIKFKYDALTEYK